MPWGHSPPSRTTSPRYYTSVWADTLLSRGCTSPRPVQNTTRRFYFTLTPIQSKLTSDIEARDEPVIRFDGANTSTKYMVVCLDLDAPHPSFPFLSPILHWIQPGLQAANEGGQRVLRASEPSISDYAPPGPPPGSPPHRYCFFLYEQPASLDGSKYASGDGAKMGLWSRMRYSLDAAEKELGLGPIVATNYFTSN